MLCRQKIYKLEDLNNSIIKKIIKSFGDRESIYNSVYNYVFGERFNKYQNLIIEYTDDKALHSYYGISYSDLLIRVFTIAEKVGIYNSVIESYKYELDDGENMCTTGRFSRLVNVLNGYTHRVKNEKGEEIEENIIEIRISDNQEIMNKISIIMRKLTEEFEDQESEEFEEAYKKDVTELLKNYSDITESDRLMYLNAI